MGAGKIFKMSLLMKNEIIRFGRLLWDKGLVCGLNGNISVRLDKDHILITATGTCLGFLTEDDIVTVNNDGDVVGKGQASSERLMHTAIYRHFPQIHAVIHTHLALTNGYFLVHPVFKPRTFEAQFYLGAVRCLEQKTPSVTDIEPLMEAFKSNHIVALKNHGVVASGKQLFDAFVLIQELEEGVKTILAEEVFKGVVSSGGTPSDQLKLKSNNSSQDQQSTIKNSCEMFSDGHIKAIVDLVNQDSQMSDLGNKTAMNMSLAVILEETQKTHRFIFKQGFIEKYDHDGQAEFIIRATENVWRAVFKGELDPFVATTQKKMSLTGDFARISKWYAPCSRIFQLWTQAPIK